ncbi:MAG TPA: phosphoadenosine phosphosulfate reductase family protein, partial [Usitatibacter sp.]|nr:phosphoadenosine phosphosulfate reductase family protein [Usitatibacter sp.]
MTLELRVQRARRLLAGIEKNHSAAVLESGFGAEDMVLLDLIARDGLAIGVVTIDTGRLPPQTHELIETVRRSYGIEVDIYRPWPDSVSAYVEQHGYDGFYEGVAESDSRREILMRARRLASESTPSSRPISALWASEVFS